MSIENSLESIAKSLEIIASRMAPAPQAAPAPSPAPQAAPAPQIAPFADPKSLMAWTMGKYKELGPVKGAGIQEVIKTLGHSRVPDVRPDQYDEFYLAVEAL